MIRFSLDEQEAITRLLVGSADFKAFLKGLERNAEILNRDLIHGSELGLKSAKGRVQALSVLIDQIHRAPEDVANGRNKS